MGSDRCLKWIHLGQPVASHPPPPFMLTCFCSRPGESVILQAWVTTLFVTLGCIEGMMAKNRSPLSAPMRISLLSSVPPPQSILQMTPNFGGNKAKLNSDLDRLAQARESERGLLRSRGELVCNKHDISYPGRTAKQQKSRGTN